VDSETSDTKEHVSAMDKIADSFLAEVEAKENASAEPTNQNGILRSSPSPEFFGGTSADTKKICSTKLYLDATS
jgi:hypothetical protein